MHIWHRKQICWNSQRKYPNGIYVVSPVGLIVVYLLQRLKTLIGITISCWCFRYVALHQAFHFSELAVNLFLHTPHSPSCASHPLPSHIILSLPFPVPVSSPHFLVALIALFLPKFTLQLLGNGVKVKLPSCAGKLRQVYSSFHFI